MDSSDLIGQEGEVPPRILEFAQATRLTSLYSKGKPHPLAQPSPFICGGWVEVRCPPNGRLERLRET